MLGLNFLLKSVQSWFPSCSLMIFSLLCTTQTAPSYRNISMALIWFQINQIHEWIFEYQVFGYLLQESVPGLTELHKMAAVQACTLKHTEDQRLDTCSKPPLPYFWIHLPYNCDLSKEEWWVCHPITESIMGNQHPKSTKQENITTHEF